MVWHTGEPGSGGQLERGEAQCVSASEGVRGAEDGLLKVGDPCSVPEHEP